MRNLVSDFSTVVACDHNLGLVRVTAVPVEWLESTFLPIFGSMSAGPGSSNLGWASVHLGPEGQNPAR